MEVAGLVAELRRTAAGEVRDDAATRELYAVDASLYRRRPAAALRALEEGDLDAAVAACRAHGVPLTMRGGGTSLAGQAVGPGWWSTARRSRGWRSTPARARRGSGRGPCSTT